MCRRIEGDLLVHRRHQRPGLNHRLPVHQHPPRQNDGLDLGAGFGQAAGDQQIIQPGFSGFSVFGLTPILFT
jgi:hypothetical protein